MRHSMLWSVMGFVFLSTKAHAEEPYSHINVRVCEVPCKGLDDPRENSTSESDKPPSLLQIPIVAIPLHSEGAWFSLSDSTLYLEEYGANRYEFASLLPLAPNTEGSFDIKDRIFRGEASPSVGDGTDFPGKTLGRIAKYRTPEAELVSLDGKLRYPFSHGLADVKIALNHHTKTLAVADLAHKIFTLSENGKAPHISIPFPNKDWTVMQVTTLGDERWMVLFSDSPSNEVPVIPQPGTLPPPPPIRSYHLYMASDQGFQTKAVKSWQGASMEFSMATTKAAAAIRVTQTQLTQNGQVRDAATTEKIYWIEPDLSLQEISSQQINHWDTREIYSGNESIVTLTRSQEKGETTVMWWRGLGKVKTSTFPNPKVGLFARQARNWNVLPNGFILFDCSPSPKQKGPAAFTNDDPAQQQIDPRSLPRHMFLLRPEGKPIGIRLDIRSIKEGEVDLVNPWNYSTVVTDGYLWFMSSGQQKGTMHVGQIPLENIFSTH